TSYPPSTPFDKLMLRRASVPVQHHDSCSPKGVTMSFYDRPRAQAQFSQAFLLFVLLFLVLLLIVPIVVVWHLFSTRSHPDETPPPPRTVTPAGNLADDEKAMIALYQKASPSVAHITSLALQRNAFTLNVQQVPKGTGSGFVWDKAGHIVTNYHVIEGA